MRLFVVVTLCVLFAALTRPSLAADPFSDKALYPTSAGVAGRDANCGMDVGPTIIAYFASRAETTRFVFVKVTNATGILGQVYATVLLPHKEVSALRDGIVMAYVPPHASTWAHIYSDSIPPGGVFLRIDGISISCDPFRLDR